METTPVPRRPTKHQNPRHEAEQSILGRTRTNSWKTQARQRWRRRKSTRKAHNRTELYEISTEEVVELRGSSNVGQTITKRKAQNRTEGFVTDMDDVVRDVGISTERRAKYKAHNRTEPYVSKTDDFVGNVGISTERRAKCKAHNRTEPYVSKTDDFVGNVGISTERRAKCKAHNRTEPYVSQTDDSMEDAGSSEEGHNKSKHKPASQSGRRNPTKGLPKRTRQERQGVTRRRNDSTTPEEDDSSSRSPPGDPRRDRRDVARPRARRGDDSTTDEDVDVPQPVPRSRRRKKPAATEVAVRDGARRRRRVRKSFMLESRRLRPVRTEWPLVDGMDPLVAEILAEMPSPRRPRDPARYEIPKRVQKPSPADLLFDAFVAECAATVTAPSTPNSPPSPTPVPAPESRSTLSVADMSGDADSESFTLTRSMFPWLLPLDYDENTERCEVEQCVTM